MPFPLRLRLAVWVHGERNIKIKEMDCKNIFSFLFFFQGSKRWIPGRAVVQLHHCSKTCSGKYMCPHLQLEASLQAKTSLWRHHSNSIRGVFTCRHQILGKHLECKEFSHLYHSQTGSSPRKALHHQRIGLLGFYNVSLSLFFFES